MDRKIRVGILGATGMVGQRFVTLLSDHPWFTITALAASERSAGKSYRDAVRGRWTMPSALAAEIAAKTVYEVQEDRDRICKEVDIVFSALDMDKETIKKIEEFYASHDSGVISNNSAHRWTEDVPMIMPEVNPEHCSLIAVQRRRRGWNKGFVTVKPNCSIQSYVPVLHALRAYMPTRAVITSMQAISGAGKTFESWPEMVDNLIPFIGGEEEKSEREPLKIWGRMSGDTIVNATEPTISATCIRVPVSDGHMASVSVAFQKRPSREEIITSVEQFQNPLAALSLPSAPKQFITFFADDRFPQTRAQRDLQKGMGISMGRLREDAQFDWRFVALSHNTLRGAAGGAVLTAELLKAKGFIS